MTGVTEDPYVRARKILLDALVGLAEHLNAVILVGAQAIYLHVGEGDLAIAPYTTDGDIALNPAALAGDPKIDALMRRAGFTPDPDRSHVGTWLAPGGVPVDLLVPEAVAGRGSRSADLGPQGNRIARRAKGLEAALVDNVTMTMTALDPADGRRISVAVAGPTALLIAKLHKLYERQKSPSRLDNKDALDIYRLLQAIPTETFADTIPVLLSDERARDVTHLGLSYLRELFGAPDAPGSRMAGLGVESLDDPERIAASCAFLTEDLLAAIAPEGSDARQ
jgi:hypothetical protein